MGAPRRSPRSSSSNVSTRTGNKPRSSSPKQSTGRRGSLKTTPSKTSTRSKSVESRSPRSPQKAKSKEGRPTSERSKGRTAEKESKPSSSRGSGAKSQNDDRKKRDAAKQVATESGSQDKAGGAPRTRRRQSRFPRTAAGKITKARRRSSTSPSGARIEEVLISPGGSSTSSRRRSSSKKSPRKCLSVIAEESSRESVATRRRSSRTSNTDCLEAQDVSLSGSLRENGFLLKQLLKKSDNIAPERGGNVYLAHAVKLLPPRDVALKILRRDFTPRRRRQFFLPQEYYICRELSRRTPAHPNIAEFHPPLLLLGSRVCFPMERYAGGDLLELLYREKTLPEAALRGYFQQALDAVQYLHDNDIAHLDLKCEHFLLDGAGSAVRLCGFGWATRFEPGRLEEDIYCPTVGYTPPEVVRRHPYDPTKADVFALGATLYILCTGKFPNPRLLDLTERAPNFPRHPEVSPALKALIRGMMESDWSKRLALEEVNSMAWMQKK